MAPPAQKGSIGALYQAVDLTGLLATAETLWGMERVWCLTWPRIADRQILVTAGGGESVDLLIAGQVEKVQFPGPGSSSNDALGKWGRSIAHLLQSQFPWMGGPTSTDVVHRGEAPVALIGITGPETGAETLAQETARALERLVMVETALQDSAVHRYLLASCGEALLAVHENGRILAGTEPGRRLLCLALYGSGRSPFKSDDVALPSHILSPILVGDTRSSHGVSITASPFRELGKSGLTEPVVLVRLRTAEPANSSISPEKLAKLTPAQKDVFELLVIGERNKQIATKLGISPYTARNHVSAVLQALGFSDRLALVARMRLSAPKPKLTVPPMVDAPGVADLLPPAKLHRQRAQKTE